MEPQPGVTREVDASRREVVRMIDRWVGANVPQHRHSAAIHTETVGSVIDRLAAYGRSAHLQPMLRTV
ncbi:DUF4254 domain-containing protein [Nocardia vermiculata]|nr:DUF4254 domain-containing protein [Nocardia vermiculata]